MDSWSRQVPRAAMESPGRERGSLEGASEDVVGHAGEIPRSCTARRSASRVWRLACRRASALRKKRRRTCIMQPIALVVVDLNGGVVAEQLKPRSHFARGPCLRELVRNQAGACAEAPQMPAVTCRPCGYGRARRCRCHRCQPRPGPRARCRAAHRRSAAASR